MSQKKRRAREAQKLWAAFGRACYECWSDGEWAELHGGDAQEIALRIGLLKPVTVTEPCGEHCWCAEYEGEITPDNPARCNRLTVELRP